MIQSIEQMPLAQRIPTLVEGIMSARARKEQDTAEEASFMDMLAKAEAELPPDSGIPLSGLIADNPYKSAAPTAPPEQEGDAVDPATGKSSGATKRGGRS